jgi:hypothetical protein
MTLCSPHRLVLEEDVDVLGYKVIEDLAADIVGCLNESAIKLQMQVRVVV